MLQIIWVMFYASCPIHILDPLPWVGLARLEFTKFRRLLKLYLQKNTAKKRDMVVFYFDIKFQQPGLDWRLHFKMIKSSEIDASILKW